MAKRYYRFEPCQINMKMKNYFKFIIKKRILSTHSIDTKIFDKLNINIKSKKFFD